MFDLRECFIRHSLYLISVKADNLEISKNAHFIGVLRLHLFTILIKIIETMKYNVVNSDVCSFPAYRPKRKFFWGAVASGIAGLFGLAGQQNNARITKEQMQMQHRMNKDEMNHSMQLQKSQQEWMLNNMYGKNVSGMTNAGLNPATANGVSPATPSGGSPSSGTSGPSASNSNLGSDMANAMLAGENMQADLDVKKAQANLLDEQANEQRFKNSDVYRNLVLRGMNTSIALDIARVSETNSNVQVNTQKIAESLTYQQKMLSDIGFTDEQKKVLTQSCVESQYRCASILQEMKESEARIVLHKAQAYTQIEIGKLQSHLAHQADTQASLNTALDTQAEANTGLIRQMKETETHKTSKSKLDAKAQELANEAVSYANQVLMAMPPEERAKYQIADILKNYWSPTLPVKFGL